ncbi:hypothetical protein DPMN_179054 [Dreissena polymorpha]|uniref:Uncharacterized protein n=1 Tax=Dreissena polymorpha TaxID=45954 RepID=A0A9D4IJ78_DREPO|nr:hypothetical protein DPMN_179054 [Dreissena polymorpha]
MEKTKFNRSWLVKLDNNGNSIGDWCVQDSSNEFAAYCFVCSKSISCANNGLYTVINHADGAKHKECTMYKRKKDTETAVCCQTYSFNLNKHIRRRRCWEKCIPTAPCPH